MAQKYKKDLKDSLDAYAVEYLGTDESADGQSAFVKTMVKKLHTRHNRRAEVPVTYEMHRVAGVWMVVDIVMDTVSVVQSNREQFDEIFGQSDTFEAGWADLMGLLRRRLESE